MISFKLHVVVTVKIRLQVMVNIVVTMYFMGVGGRSVAYIVSDRSPYVVWAWKSTVAAIMIDVKPMSVAVLVVAEFLSCVRKWWFNDIFLLAVVVEVLLVTERLLLVTERLSVLVLSAAKVTVLLSVVVV